MLKLRPMLHIALLCCLAFNHTTMAHQANNFLLQPSGQYGVGFEDFHWINTKLCPDPLATEKNKNNLSPENKQHCRELMVRVYYPTAANSYAASPYYRPIIEFNQNNLRNIPGVKRKDIEQLALLKSHIIKNATPLKNKTFPVIVFSPGFGAQTQSYENTITDLVSHGYIVVGINSLFINGGIELPNGHVVQPLTVEAQDRDKIKQMLQVLAQDIAFVYHEIHMKSQNPVLQAMDLKHMGALGHSIGGKSMASVVSQHPDWFQALITEDMASYQPNDSIMQFKVPYMHIISAYWKSFYNWPLRYHLDKKGYLVVLSPSEKDKYYSYHMNFSDSSTLQYMPASQAFMALERSKLALGEDVLIQATPPGKNEFKNIKKPTYLIVKSQNIWKVFYYEPKAQMREIDLNLINGLQSALEKLPSVEQLTQFDKDKINNRVHIFHQQYGNFLGKGNGYKITEAINAYVLNFFDHFLKNKASVALEKCVNKIADTVLECGRRD